MRLLLQRVTKAKVTSSEKVAQIKAGVVIFAGFHIQDHPLVIEKMVKKFFNLHYFSDDNDTKNKAKYTIIDKQKEVLVVSQFTLFADVKKGKNPSWHKAAVPEHAQKLYYLFCEKMMEYYPKIKTGVFGAYMQVELLNDGPFTLLLDSQELFPQLHNQ